MLDSSSLALKKDHESRPVWVSADGRIILETFSSVYKEAYDFLVAIAEPVSRPELVHEYRLTPYSLYAAVSVGLEADNIISVLTKLCKTTLPPNIVDFIRDSTKTYGKAKLVLQKGKYLVQSADTEVLKTLLSNKVIRAARIVKSNPGDGEKEDGLMSTVNTEQDAKFTFAGGETAVNDQTTLNALQKALDDDDDDEEESRQTLNDKKVFSFEVAGEQVEHVKRVCIELDYPLMEEYDFRNDSVNKSVDMDLKPIAKIRPYQEKSLAKMFGNGRARSGVIVLPCGAGKSLTGVTAACTIRKPTLCLCTSSVSVEQWRYQFSLWSTKPRDEVGRFAAGGEKGKNIFSGVLVTTYSMIAHSGKRAVETQKMLDRIKDTEWGLILLDEVHVVPANMFRKVLGVIKAHCKLGLTATLLREDQKIGDINFLIGPKLYEANWLDLQRAGYLATVHCAEVWCPMTGEFYREYLTQTPAKRKLLYAMNPNKFRMCQYLVRYHSAKKDKIIIFSDNIFALKQYAIRLNAPFIYGPTTQKERMRVLHHFQTNSEVNCILLSKVGDTSIDIPEANVLIQVSSHFGSRRQEAQRLGRILRPKPRAGQNFNAFFYSLVSTDTQEMFYSQKRQQFLVDQGYSFKIITQLEGMDRDETLDFGTKEKQLLLLQQVLAADEGEASERIVDEDLDRMQTVSGARRATGSLAALSGAKGMSYREVNRGPEVLEDRKRLGIVSKRHAL
mmetsp:Transcript_8471/g.37770  ORF Transcript_8471/g.37770 Transcript_8471/m.37770 type:complete len:728 (+) Transcript_8471:771-2954(+)